MISDTLFQLFKNAINFSLNALIRIIVISIVFRSSTESTISTISVRIVMMMVDWVMNHVVVLCLRKSGSIVIG